MHIEAHDTLDASGHVVATVLTVPAGNGQVGNLNFFRGRERCEAWIKGRHDALDRYR